MTAIGDAHDARPEDRRPIDGEELEGYADEQRDDLDERGSEQHAWRRLAYIAIALASTAVVALLGLSVLAFLAQQDQSDERQRQLTALIDEGRQSRQSFIASDEQARKNFLADQRAETRQRQAQTQTAAADAQRSRAETRQADAGALLAQAQTERENAVGPFEQLAQSAEARSADAQARRESALMQITGALEGLLKTMERQLGNRPKGETDAERESSLRELALQLAELIDQTGPAGPTGGR